MFACLTMFYCHRWSIGLSFLMSHIVCHLSLCNFSFPPNTHPQVFGLQGLYFCLSSIFRTCLEIFWTIKVIFPEDLSIFWVVLSLTMSPFHHDDDRFKQLTSASPFQYFTISEMNGDTQNWNLANKWSLHHSYKSWQRVGALLYLLFPLSLSVISDWFRPFTPAQPFQSLTISMY